MDRRNLEWRNERGRLRIHPRRKERGPECLAGQSYRKRTNRSGCNRADWNANGTEGRRIIRFEAQLAWKRHRNPIRHAFDFVKDTENVECFSLRKYLNRCAPASTPCSKFHNLPFSNPGNFSPIHRKIASAVSPGFSKVTQCPASTTASVKFGQEARIGSASLVPRDAQTTSYEQGDEHFVPLKNR